MSNVNVLIVSNILHFLTHWDLNVFLVEVENHLIHYVTNECLRDVVQHDYRDHLNLTFLFDVSKDNLVVKVVVP